MCVDKKYKYTYILLELMMQMHACVVVAQY